MMRGDDGASLEIDVIRAAYDLRRLDAPERAGRAISRAKRLGDVDRARALVDTLCEYRNRRLFDLDELGPTPETLVRHRHCRQRGDTIAALFGNLDFCQQAAALQVSSIFECLTAKLWARACRWEQGRLDSSSNGGGIPERIAQLYHNKYRPWVTWMRDPASLFQVCTGCDRRYARRIIACECGGKRFWRAPPHLPLVLDICVFGSGLEAAAKTYRMRRQRALRLLQLGLSRYCDFG
jgi:hypothetical protein